MMVANIVHIKHDSFVYLFKIGGLQVITKFGIFECDSD